MNLLSLDNSARLIQIWDQQKTTGIDKDYPKKVIKNLCMQIQFIWLII